VWQGPNRQLVVLIVEWAEGILRAKKTVGCIDYEMGRRFGKG
jgi:hypothetical protein